MKAVVALLIALAGCAQPSPQEQARRVADAYMEARGYNRGEGPEIPVTVTEEGPHWVVNYGLPEGWAGGTSHVSVDKRTMQVVDFIGSQ